MLLSQGTVGHCQQKWRQQQQQQQRCGEALEPSQLSSSQQVNSNHTQSKLQLIKSVERHRMAH